MKHLHLSKIYLEIARLNIRSLKDSLKRENLTEEQTSNILFASYSLSLNYSYAAVEAFINKRFLAFWELAKSIASDEPQRRLNINYEVLRKFNNKTKNISKAKEFKNYEFGELKDKINVVCDISNIARISKQNIKLWAKFNTLIKDNRHFTIHPDSTQPTFSSKAENILSHKIEETPVIAAQMIGYFFEQKDLGIPSYLQKNTLFELTVEIIPNSKLRTPNSESLILN